jgi:uncharacterized protein YdhG (YjbR/CyaY superfamily)
MTSLLGVIVRDLPSPKPADQPAEVRAALVKVRAAMRRALPDSVEAIKYGMPAYLVEGRAVASFAGWKTQYALYIVAPALFDAIAKDLVGRDASTGIIRFGLDEPVPESVVERLATWGGADAARAAPRVLPRDGTLPDLENDEKAGHGSRPEPNTVRASSTLSRSVLLGSSHSAS